ncbi:hypothetical protein ACFLWG_02450 [Chloroflexota bacterium]
MPGISLIYKKHLAQNNNLIAEGIEDLRYPRTCTVEKLIENSNFLLAFSGYNGYPNSFIENDEFAILFEGLIYNKDEAEVESSLKAISWSYLENKDYRSAIKEFVDNSDGDYIVSIYFKHLDESVIFNDRWGRLPSYYYFYKDMFVFTRDMRFILHFIPRIQFDKFGVVQFLVFEYTLGDRTLIRDIHRVSPSCLFHLKPSAGTLKVDTEQLFDVNLEHVPNKLSKNECIERCKDLFLESTSNRINKMKEKKYNITADLSGGWDTRAVLGGLSKFNAKVDYYTDCLITGDESEWAEGAAALYNIKPIRIAASHDLNYFDMSELTYMTGCTVESRTQLCCYYDLLERTKYIKDVSASFGGLGSDFMRKPYKVRGRYKTLTDMLEDDHFVRFIKIKQACSIVNLDEETFYKHLRAYFNEYPEPTLGGKVKHLYFEYQNNLVNGGGENRFRLHFWTVQTKWSKDLFSFETKFIPTEYIGEDFFLDFIRAIDPVLFNAPIYRHEEGPFIRFSLFKAILIRKLTGILFISRRLFRFALKTSKLIRKTKHRDNNEAIKKDILHFYKKLNILASSLDERSIKKFFQNEYKVYNLYNLLTVILYFKEIENRYGDKVVPCE